MQLNLWPLKQNYKKKENNKLETLHMHHIVYPHPLIDEKSHSKLSQINSTLDLETDYPS